MDEMRKLLSAVSLLLLIATFAWNKDQRQAADYVIRNARVYTVDSNHPWAEAIAIRSDKILWTGKDQDVDSFISSSTRVEDAGGRLILPGWIDSHFHVLLGSNPDVLSINNATSLKEIQQQVQEFSQSRPELKWIEAEGWNYSAFPDGTLPSAKDLEGLTAERPAFLIAYDYHTVWLNREALREFGIDSQTKAVTFAEKIEKDPETGEPTGILIGYASAGMSQQAEADLRKHLPSHSEENMYLSIRENVAAAARVGITTIIDPQSFPEDMVTYSQMRNKGELPVRLQVALLHRIGISDAEMEEFEETRKKYDDDFLRTAAIKLYIDDVIEPHTAAMLEPYTDRPDETGALLYEPEEFSKIVAGLDKRKFQLLIHAIGDRGIRTALDALEHARKTNGIRDSRHQLVHIECLSPQDVSRFSQLGVTACMQPRHCAPDITGQWAKAVGPERSKYAWAFRSLKESGALLAFASDWNVAEMDPLIGIYSAMTRKGLDGTPAKGWIPEQTIDLETAIRAYTINGAYANFMEHNRGSITQGKYADLIMLSDNLFQLPPDKIKDARVLLTIVGGREVYRAK
jgi:predicted amidohydrolase YtcJ